MALKKAELLELREKYDIAMSLAREAESHGMYAIAIDRAIEAWPFIDGMMQYCRRFEETEFKSVAAIDMVLRYAPLLFNSAALEKLGAMLKAEKRIDKNASADLAAMLTKARERLWMNHRMFCHLEERPGTRQDMLRTEIGGDQDYWRSAAEAWAAMGLLRREPVSNSYRLTLVTRLGEVVWGKCPNCGDRAQAPKAMFLEALSCTACKKSGEFVFVEA